MGLRLDTRALGREVDRYPGALLGHCVLLLLVSVLALRSASLTPDGGSLHFAERQLGWALAGLGCFFAASLVPYDRLGRRWPALWGLGLLALVGVLVLGTKVNGARSWFSLGPVRLQPSELMKPLLALALAHVAARLGPRLATFGGLARAALVALVPFGLVLLQPDLGTALCFVPISLAIVFAGGARLRHLLGAFAGALACLPLVWCFLLAEYQKLRILSFLDRDEHALGGAYQVTQSVIAIGSGGLLGRGAGQGTQGPLGFLPERHTDFVFAVVCEDWGLLGGALVLGLYASLVALLLEQAHRTRDPEGRGILVGLAAVTATQVVVNVGMVLGVMPVTGIPLPLLSYGGSSLVASMLGFGLAASVARHRSRVALTPGAPREAPERRGTGRTERAILGA